MQQEVGMSFHIRPLTAGDENFLWQMLYYAAHMNEEEGKNMADLAADPVLANYVKGWGRTGDLGFIAIENGSDTPLGAAWIRVPSPDHRTFGYRDEYTPELAVAVRPDRTGQGIGTALLNHLLAAAHGRYSAILLSVREENPAHRLYERLGFTISRELINRVGGRSLEMVFKFSEEA
jgi:ribosomal protein S18 acetylase RimI-like enzyme